MIWLNGHPVTFSQFPNGETYADIPECWVNTDKENKISFKFETDNDIFNLMRVRALVEEKASWLPCELWMPYIPYSRMDRAEEERLFSLKYFANAINAMNFSCVYVMEPHSDVSGGLLNRLKVKDMSMHLALSQAMMGVLGLSGTSWYTRHQEYSDKSDEWTIEGLYRKAKEAHIYMVFPDAGAEKRYSKQTKFGNILTCSKKREFSTGAIKSLELHGAEDARDCTTAIIVDDLVAKGGTFKFTAQALRKELPKLETVILCVTHCENTIYDGDLITGDDVQLIYTTDSILTRMPDSDRERKKLKVMKIL